MFEVVHYSEVEIFLEWDTSLKWYTSWSHIDSNTVTFHNNFYLELISWELTLWELVSWVWINSSMKKRWCWSIEEDGSCDDEELNESFFLEDSDDDTSANITSKTAMPNQKINLGEEYKHPLYPASQIFILMTYLFIFQFSIRHSLTESALKELLLLISVLLPV